MHLLFITAPKRGSFCYSKAWQNPKPRLDVRRTSNLHKIALKTQWEEEKFVSYTLMMLHWPQLLQKCRIACYFSTALMWNVSAVIPSRGGIFRGCTVSILKNGNVICRSHFEQLLSCASLCTSLITGFGAIWRTVNCKAPLNYSICLGYSRIALPLRKYWPIYITRDF